jgi:FtsP/CotA-like multicopper oxidase with cupredoxin domain
MIADWNHVTSDELYQIESDTNIDVYCAQSILFNGQGRVTCLTEEQQSAALAPPFKDLYNGPLSGTKLTPAGCAPFIPFTQRPGPINPTGLPQTITGCTPTQSELHNFEVQACKKYANFHLMSAASILAPVVSLDEHDMWVYAIDGRYVEPYKVNAVQIFNGDRYSVMVPLDKEPGSYTFRANHFGFNQLIGGFASVTYSQTCDGGNNNTGNGTDVGHIGGGDGGGGELPPTYGQPMHYGSPPSPSAPSAPSYPAAGVKPNGKTGYDCGIPRHTVGGCYSANEPDWKSNMAPMPEPPRVPSEYDWIGPLPPPQPTTYTTYQPSAEQTGVPSYETPADTPTSPQPAPYGTLNNSNSALPASSGCPKSSYAKRADQHRGRLWKRQSPTPTPGNSTESKPWITYGGFPVDSSVILLNETDVVPFPNIPPPQEVSQTHIFAMSRTTAPWLWKVGGESYASKPQEYAEDAPLLYYPESVNAQNDNLVITTQNNTWVDLIFTVPDAFGPPHPMHKHANKAYVIGRGTGNFTWNNVAEAAAAQPQNFNFDSPQLRDGYATAPSQGQPVWLAIRYHVNNPGAWMLHCHVQTHLTGGMAVALLEGVGQFPEFPLEYATADSTGLGPASRPLASSPS